MRDIKFRAWNKTTKEYNKYVEICCYTDGSVGVSAGAENNTPIGNTEDFILEQFTGLTDKNGLEIYEGDILKTEGIVSWNDVEHRWSVIDLDRNDKREWHDIDYTTVPLEVIGNIHQNPELL